MTMSYDRSPGATRTAAVSSFGFRISFVIRIATFVITLHNCGDILPWRALFPLNRAGGLAADVVNHAIHSTDRVRDPRRNGLQDFPRPRIPIGLHEVFGLARPDSHHLVIRPELAHHPHALH